MFQFALVCSLCASLDATGQPLEKRVLKEFQTRFFEVVAAKDIYRELCLKKVIHQIVADKITNSHSVQDARGHLFDHMRDYGTLDALKVFCDVISSEKYDGFQAMQVFGSEMKRRLEQEGRCVCWWVGRCGGVPSELHLLRMWDMAKRTSMASVRPIFLTRIFLSFFYKPKRRKARCIFK